MILFRTNGGKDSGLGHIMRCLSLAKALLTRWPDKKVVFRANEEMRPLVIENGYEFQSSQQYDKQDAEIIKRQNLKIVIFDSYLADTDYLRTIKQNTVLVQFDDNNDIYIPLVADILINGNIHAPSLNYKMDFATNYVGAEDFPPTEQIKLLLGPKYLIMREEYQNDSEEKQGTGILITTGGSDFLNLMPEFITALKDTVYFKKIIIGPAYTEEQIKNIEKMTEGNKTFKLIYKPKSLKEHIQGSEIIITAAGSTVYEVLRLKKIPLIYTLADNQKKIEAALKQRQVFSLGDYKEIAFEKELLAEKIEAARRNENNISDLYDIFDGKGVFRIVEEICG
jgi:spore coat polysaccharide biosynthesis predicted glycosyltransferase SpsG